MVVVTGGADRLATAPYISKDSGNGNLIIAAINIPREESLSLTLSKTMTNTLDSFEKAGNVHRQPKAEPAVNRRLYSRSWMSSLIYRGFGGSGFGTPVVSYAPRPIFEDVIVRGGMKT